MPSPDLRYRLAQPADIPAVALLDHEAFSPYGTSEEAAVFVRRLAVFPAGFLVVTEGETVVGYGCGEKWLSLREPQMGEDAAATHHAAGTVFCLTAMAVKITHRRQGIGREIVVRLMGIAQAQGCTEIVLETTHAQKLYQGLGFREIGIRRQDGVALSIMHYDFAEETP